MEQSRAKRLWGLSLALTLCLPLYAKNLTYKVGDETFEGYFLKKAAGSPTVFIMHDWDGLTEYEVRRVQMLHKLGYAAFALDLFGKGVRPTEDKDRRQHIGELMKDRQKLRDRI